MEATLETLEAPAPTPVPVPAPVAPSEETSTPLQPSTSAKLNAHNDTDLSPGVRTRSMVQRSSSPSDMVSGSFCGPVLFLSNCVPRSGAEQIGEAVTLDSVGITVVEARKWTTTVSADPARGY